MRSTGLWVSGTLQYFPSPVVPFLSGGFGGSFFSVSSDLGIGGRVGVSGSEIWVSRYFYHVDGGISATFLITGNFSGHRNLSGILQVPFSATESANFSRDGVGPVNLW